MSQGYGLCDDLRIHAMDNDTVNSCILFMSIILFPMVAISLLVGLNRLINKIQYKYFLLKILLQKKGWYGMLIHLLHLIP